MKNAVEPLPGIDVRTGWDNPFRTVTVAGELDVVSARAVSVPLSDAIEERPPGVVLDLMSVTFFGATGITTVLNAVSRAEEREVSLVVACGPHIARVFDMTDTTDLVDALPSRRAALLALAGTRSAVG